MSKDRFSGNTGYILVWKIKEKFCSTDILKSLLHLQLQAFFFFMWVTTAKIKIIQQDVTGWQKQTTKSVS